MASSPTLSDSRRSLQVGEWLVQPQLNRIRRGEEIRQLEPRTVELLCFLAAHPRQVLSKQELVEGVWGGAFLSDSALTRTISELRRALDDDAQAPRYIETIPKRGYRLLAAVETVQAGEAPAASRSTEQGHRLLAWLLGAALLVVGAVVVGLQLGRGGDRVEDSAASEAKLGLSSRPDVRLRQITTGEELEVHPSLSPDGSRLAYSSDRTGSLELWVRQLTPGSEELQLTDDGEQNLAVAWSPDGRLLAYQSEGRGGIWLVPALGGEPRRLTRFGGAPSWSPDGGSVAFHSGAGFELLLSSYPTMPPSILYRVSSDGGEPIPLTEQGWPPGGHGVPAWSPAGEWIAFLASDFGSTSLWLLRLEDGELFTLDEPISPRSIAWSPDGRRLWVAFRAGDDEWLGAVAVGSGGFGALEAVVRAPLRHLTVRSDGRGVIGSRLEQRSTLWTLALDPRNHRPVGDPQPLTRGTQRRDTRPAISPDGERAVFVRGRAGQSPQLFLIDLPQGSSDSGELVQLTLDEELAVHSPVWLEGGGEVQFLAAGAGGLSLRVVDVGTREVREVARLGPDWRALRPSHDGTRVAFYVTPRARAANVWVAPVGDPAGANQVTFDDGFVGFPVWSPDDRYLAVELAAPYGYQLAVVPAEGGELRQLTDESGEHWPGSWSPDSRRILFAASRQGIWGLRWIDRDGGDQVEIVPGDRIDVYYRYPAWSPTGDRIVYERGEVEADLWEVELP